MPVRLPEPHWPSELLEEGPPADPAILLGGAAEIGNAPHRVLAVRLNPRTLAVDYRTDLEENIYADYQLDGMLDELTFLDDIDKSVLVPIGGGYYVVWMMPFSGPDDRCRCGRIYPGPAGGSRHPTDPGNTRRGSHGITPGSKIVNAIAAKTMLQTGKLAVSALEKRASGSFAAIGSVNPYGGVINSNARVTISTTPMCAGLIDAWPVSAFDSRHSRPVFPVRRNSH